MGTSNSTTNSNNIQRFEYINHNTGNILNYYEISSHIGIGKSATVYHAIDRKTKLPRAVKELRKSNMNRESTDAFESEVKTLKSLDHPNIMKTC
jgi:calcium-dependent protein kinase